MESTYRVALVIERVNDDGDFEWETRRSIVDEHLSNFEAIICFRDCEDLITNADMVVEEEI